ncbi:MAG TPA: hypothetical protein VGN63_19795 [Flavisolibacter sp.]|jgi:hypothetical protein|nr:hypothetical protein [Flavisolibacter sp.]
MQVVLMKESGLHCRNKISLSVFCPHLNVTKRPSDVMNLSPKEWVGFANTPQRIPAHDTGYVKNLLASTPGPTAGAAFPVLSFFP